MKQPKPFIIDILFVLALFGVFTLSALMVVSIGAEVYRHTVADMDKNYELRTTASYLTEKVRQSDFFCDMDNISVSDFSGIQTLTLSREVDGEIFYTHLYYHDGYLKELFTRSENYLDELSLGAGQKIMSLSDFTPKQIGDNLITLTFTTTGGRNETLFLSTHCSP